MADHPPGEVTAPNPQDGDHHCGVPGKDPHDPRSRNTIKKDRFELGLWMVMVIIVIMVADGCSISHLSC